MLHTPGDKSSASEVLELERGKSADVESRARLYTRTGDAKTGEQ